MKTTTTKTDHDALQLQQPAPRPARHWADRLAPAGLVAFSVVPILAGAMRLAELSGGAQITPANARFFASPVPVALHIISVSLYAVLGAFQFAPGFRRRRRGWHRAAGRLLVPAGLVAALSGLWMTLFYPWPAGDGAILYALRLLVGSAMLGSILLGVEALRQRDFANHGAWMLRGYALGMGAGTQVLTHPPWVLLFGAPGEIPRALLMGAGWAIDLALAEWIILRISNRRATLHAGRRAPYGQASSRHS